MKISHYYANGAIECGIVDDQGKIRAFAPGCELADLPPRERFDALLTMAPNDREVLNQSMLAGGPIVTEGPKNPEGQSILAPAVPYPPLYIYNHGNSPTIYKRQRADLEQQGVTRMPHFRIRPWSSLSGHGDAVPIRQECDLMFGLELGIVIGQRAHRVDIEHAAEHIAGIVGLDDAFLDGIFADYYSPDNERRCYPLLFTNDTMCKSADGMGGVGPCVITVEELQREHVARIGTQRQEAMKEKTHKSSYMYDLLLRSYIDGRCVDRTHSGAYLFGSEFLVSLLSRFMTLETGTIIGLGSPGWDGIYSHIEDAPDAFREVGGEIENFGMLKRKMSRQVKPDELTDGPLVTRRRALGLPGAPPPEEKAPKAFWQLRGNFNKAGELADIPDWVGPCPYCIPLSTLRNDTSTLVIPPHATDVECTVQLATVLDGGPLYNKPGDEAAKCVTGVAVMLQLWDRSFIEGLVDISGYEYRSGRMLGYFADGFSRIGSMAPLADVGDLKDLKMAICCSNGKREETNTSEYRHGFGIMLEAICNGSTVFPGDVFSLGQADVPLVLERGKMLPAGTTLTASIEGLGEICVKIDDQRVLSEQRD